MIQLPDIENDDQGLKALPHEIGHILGLPDRYKTKYNHITAEQEREHQGQLMGRRLPNGQREIDSQEVGEIAVNAGLTCNFERCCIRQAHPVHGQHLPAGEAKVVRLAYCELGFPTGEWTGTEPREPDDGLPPGEQRVDGHA